MRSEDSGDIGGAGGNSVPVIDPASIATPEPARRRGGWPKGKPRGPRSDGSGSGTGDGTGTAARAKKAPASDLDVGTVTLIVSFLGGAIAARAKQPALALDHDESARIADATVNVAKHYNIPVSPLAQAWMALGMTVGTIYSAKIMAVRMQRLAQ